MFIALATRRKGMCYVITRKAARDSKVSVGIVF